MDKVFFELLKASGLDPEYWGKRWEAESLHADWTPWWLDTPGYGPFKLWTGDAEELSPVFYIEGKLYLKGELLNIDTDDCRWEHIQTFGMDELPEKYPVTVHNCKEFESLQISANDYWFYPDET